ncbi:DNA-directed RNA polymerase III, subunit Rpc31 [Chaetomidium leptoderma]|uniref:DNA-directed RNA polymerase III subunit n=1 Tax=Chaetomidium leptoderma TaxID=669021 RepID=A0AAN6VPG0_9PEZI|nr:DNA-directed RNA polymerase III, subunit Rpc31 [Chaetomidium leptoderma]
MSGRGGRGGRGRGGPMANGRRAVAQNSVPWAMDSDIVLDGKPSELFPPYNLPKAPLLSKKEDKQVSYFLLFREQCQDSALYTQARSWTQASGGTARTYGQDQVNRRYGQVTKATVDPFTAVPTYSHRFKTVPRTLPDLGSRPFAKEFFPPELHATLEGEDEPPAAAAAAAAKRRRVGPKTLGLSNITSYKTAEELFLPEVAQQKGVGGDANLDKALQLLNSMEKRNEDGDEEAFLSGEDDDDWVKGNGDDDEDAAADEDDQYEDESGDDYNAEAYFDGNQDDEDGDEGGDEGGDFF